MSGGQDWAAELISTGGGDMSDKQSCHSRVSDNDLILVRWQDEQDGGWREGVLCAIVASETGDGKATDMYYCVSVALMRQKFEMCGDQRAYTWIDKHGQAVIYDHHRNERAIVPIAKVQIVEPRCDVCEGTGAVKVTNIKHEWMDACAVCHGSGRKLR